MSNAQSMLTTPAFLYIHRITFNNGGHGIPMAIGREHFPSRVFMLSLVSTIWEKYHLFQKHFTALAA